MRQKTILMVQFGKIQDIQMSGFLSRAIVNSRNVNMRGGLRSIPLGFFFSILIKCIFSGLLSISKSMKALLLFNETYLFEFGEK